MRTVIVVVFAALASVAGMACAHASGGSIVAAPSELEAEVGAVDLNAASAPDLIALPGIGPAKAEAILAYRKKHGTFKRVDELRNVKGFGRKTVAKLRPLVKVVPPATVAAAATTPGSEDRRGPAPRVL